MNLLKVSLLGAFLQITFSLKPAEAFRMPFEAFGAVGFHNLIFSNYFFSSSSWGFSVAILLAPVFTYPGPQARPFDELRAGYFDN